MTTPVNDCLPIATCHNADRIVIFVTKLKSLEQQPEISIVVPLFNEAESLPELHDWIVRVLNERQLSYEIVFVDDGSKDESWDVIESLQAKDPNVRGIKFQRNYGKSAALAKRFRSR